MMPLKRELQFRVCGKRITVCFPRLLCKPQESSWHEEPPENDQPTKYAFWLPNCLLEFFKQSAPIFIEAFMAEKHIGLVRQRTIVIERPTLERKQVNEDEPEFESERSPVLASFIRGEKTSADGNDKFKF